MDRIRDFQALWSLLEQRLALPLVPLPLFRVSLTRHADLLQTLHQAVANRRISQVDHFEFGVAGRYVVITC